MAEATLCIIALIAFAYGLVAFTRNRKPRLEFDCEKDRHMWGAIERKPSSDRHWLQNRTCQLCNFLEVYDQGGWGPAVGSLKK